MEVPIQLVIFLVAGIVSALTGLVSVMVHLLIRINSSLGEIRMTSADVGTRLLRLEKHDERNEQEGRAYRKILYGEAKS